MAIRLGINGFGRIGRCAFRQLTPDDDFAVVGINDLAPVDDLAYLLQYDSVHGRYDREVAVKDGSIVVDDEQIPFFDRRDPAEIPWGDLGAEIVIESSGAFRSRDAAAKHLSAGAERVIISAPSDDADATLICGVNADSYDPESHEVVSNASCTTNCLAPVAKVLNDSFGIEHLLMSTVHAYTASQSLMDKPTRKRRRGRAAALSIVPTTTGAARATTLAIPELEGRMDGMAFRVPVEDGSVIDAVALLETAVTVDEVHRALEEAAAGPMRGILAVSDEDLVSRDIVGTTFSAIVDTHSTMVLGDRVVKVVAWYDNEWGYAARLLDLARLMAARGSSTRS